MKFGIGLGGLIGIVVVIIAGFWLNGGVGTSEGFKQQGSSMEPAFYDGSNLFIAKVSVSSIRRGDMVLFLWPRNTAVKFVKRVIGLPGETAEVKGGKVYINGKVLNEPYISGDTPTDVRVTLNKDEYFVMGDNRQNSSDSRNWGPVLADYITGRVTRINGQKVVRPDYGI